MPSSSTRPSPLRSSPACARSACPRTGPIPTAERSRSVIRSARRARGTPARCFVSPSAAPGKELKIGALLPFTGVYAELGNSMRRATELYLKQNDQKLANRPVKLIYEDDTNVTATGIQKAQKFIDQDQVDVIMGVVPTPLAYGIRNAVHEAKMIFIDTNAGGNALTRDTPDS